MTAFTPVSATVGGALIGLSASVLWAANGRIAGISGIAGGLISPARGDAAWRVAFLAGMVGAPLFLAMDEGVPAIAVPATAPMLVVAGFLVGFGSRLGGGCTSGHGVCGIARLSRRSITATIVSWRPECSWFS